MSIDNTISVVFIGSGDFALPSLKVLANLPAFEVKAVFTQPDKKAGRNQEVKSSVIKDFSQGKGLSCLQPEKIAEAKKIIGGLKPDFIIVCDYGQIISKEILAIPKVACLNIHASLLPRFRGASPMQSALLHGDKDTGISFIQMTEKLDSGPVFLIRREKIKEDDTYSTLAKRLAEIAAVTLIPLLSHIKERGLTPLPQSSKNITYCFILKKEDGEIHWAKKTAEEVFNQIRAYEVWPGSYTFFRGKRLKITEANYDLKFQVKVAGQVSLDQGKVVIFCSKGGIYPLKVQLEGKKEISMADFLRGHRDFSGATLG